MADEPTTAREFPWTTTGLDDLFAAKAERDRLADVIDRAAEILRRSYSITVGDRDGETRGLHRVIGEALDVLAEAEERS